MASGAASVGLAIRGPIEDHSGTVTVAGQSQKLLDGNYNWNYIYIQNPSNQIEPLYLNFEDDASIIAADSMELLPGEKLIFKTPGYISTQQINITAATLNHPFICKAC